MHVSNFIYFAPHLLAFHWAVEDADSTIGHDVLEFLVRRLTGPASR